MAIAQKIAKRTTIRKQTGLGVPGSATGQVLRRTSSVFKATRDTNKSAEVVGHHQSSGVTYGLKKTDGNISGELSASTYQIPIEAMLEANFATGGTVTATDIASTSTTFTSVAAAFLTSGFKVGDVVRASGFTGDGLAVVNARNYLITALTAGVMTGFFLDGTTQVEDAAGEEVTIAVVGKKCKPPMTGHTKDYLQVEEWYSDLTDSDLFSDVIISGIDFDLPATGNATFASTYVGLQRAVSGTQVMTTPTAETETGIMTALNGILYVNGVSTRITGLKISIKNGAAHTGAEVGSNVSDDISRMMIDVEGSFTSMLRDQVVSALYEAETEVSLFAVLTADETATSHFMGFSLGKVRITGDAPDDNTSIVRTYPFTARLNTSGGAALAWDKTIITIQDSAAA